jgi:hypothetical protein
VGQNAGQIEKFFKNFFDIFQNKEISQILADLSMRMNIYLILSIFFVLLPLSKIINS